MAHIRVVFTPVSGGQRSHLKPVTGRPSIALRECYNRVSRRGLSLPVRAQATGRSTHFRELQRSYVRPLEMGDHQAQEGRAGRQARQDLHPPDQGNHHGRRAAAATRTATRACARRSLAAKAENMPQDNIKRAIQRGTGELPGAQLRRDHLRRLRPRRRGDAGRDLDRQPQPHRQRNPPCLLEERRQSRRQKARFASCSPRRD